MTKVEKKERYGLIDDIDKSVKKENENIGYGLLISLFLVLFTLLLIILPKIYLKNEIYYNSKEISKLYNEYSVLKEENVALKQKLENVKFKNQVLDTIF